MRTIYQSKDFSVILCQLQSRATRTYFDPKLEKYEFFERIYTIEYKGNTITKIYSDPKP